MKKKALALALALILLMSMLPTPALAEGLNGAPESGIAAEPSAEAGGESTAPAQNGEVTEPSGEAGEKNTAPVMTLGADTEPPDWVTNALPDGTYTYTSDGTLNLTLTQDATIKDGALLDVRKNFTLDLAGYTLTGAEHVVAAVTVADGATLTIVSSGYDNGKILGAGGKSAQVAVSNNSGACDIVIGENVTVQGGNATYYGSDQGGQGVYIVGGSITIERGGKAIGGDGGSLSGMGACGAVSYSGSITIKDGGTAKGGDGNGLGGNGVQTDSGSITVESGGTAIGGDSNGDAGHGVVGWNEAVNIVILGTATGGRSIDGGKDGVGVYVEYPVWVNGQQVMWENKDNVLGDNTVRYDSATRTLTLNGATIAGDGIEMPDGATLALSGTNEVNKLTCTGTLTLTGTLESGTVDLSAVTGNISYGSAKPVINGTLILPSSTTVDEALFGQFNESSSGSIRVGGKTYSIAKYAVTVPEGYTASPSAQHSGLSVTLSAASVPAGKHIKWAAEGLSFTYTNEKSAAFTMPAKDVSVTASEEAHTWTYTASDKTLTASCFCKATETLTLAAPTDLTYNGSAKGAALTRSAAALYSDLKDVRVSYEKKGADDTYGSISSAPVNVGTYRASITVDDDKTVSVEYTIAPKTVTPTITLEYDTHVYTGGELKPTVTVKDGDRTIPASEYSVSYTDNTNIGDSAKVTITDKEGGNYALNEASASYSITPIVVELTWGKTSFTYNGGAQKPDATVSNKLDTDEVSVTVAGAQKDANDTDTPYTATASGLSGENAGNYTLEGAENTTQSFTIAKDYPVVTNVQKSYPDLIYDTTPFGEIWLSHGAEQDTSGTLKLDAGQSLTVGTKDYSWTFTPVNTRNYHTKTGKISLEVVADTLSEIEVKTEPSKTEYTYGESFDKAGMEVMATYISGRYVDVTADVTISPAVLTTDVTELTISYGGKSTTQSITVKPKTVTPDVTLEYTTHVYTGGELKPSVTVKDGDTTIPTSEYSVSYSGDCVNVGTSATVTITEVAGGNYALNEASASYSITPIVAELTWGNTSFTYNEGEQKPDATVSNKLGTDEVSVTVNGAQRDANDTDIPYTATASGLSGEDAGNYTLEGAENTTQSFTIAKDYPWVTQVQKLSPQEIYDTTPFGEIHLTNNVQDDTPGTLALDAGQSLTVGTKDYSWTFTPADLRNYYNGHGKISLEVVADTLSKLEVTTEPSRTEYTYGESFDKAGMVVTASYLSFNTVNVTDAVTISPAVLTTDVTELTISYGGMSVKQSITVKPKTVTPAITLEYDTHVYTGGELKPSVTVMDGTERIPASEYEVSYPVDCVNVNTGLTVTVTNKTGGNYKVNEATASYSITPKPITAPTAPTAAFTYNGKAQSYMPAAEGYTVEGATQTMANESGYAVTAKLSDKHNTVWSDGGTDDKSFTFIIKKAPLTVKAEDKSIVVGDKKPVYTAVTTGLVNGESISGVSLADNAKDTNTAGIFTITPSGGTISGGNDNYRITYAPGKLTITAPSSSGDTSGGGTGGYIAPAQNSAQSARGDVRLSGVNIPRGDALITTPAQNGALFKLLGSNRLIGMWDISLRSGRTSIPGSTLSFNVGRENAGRIFTLYHLKADGTEEKFSAVANAEGIVSFYPINELSPFMLVQGGGITTTSILEVPATGDVNAGLGLLLLSMAIMAAAVLMKRRKGQA